MKTCSTCGGSGKIKVEISEKDHSRGTYKKDIKYITCTTCGGSGKVKDD